MILVRVRVPWLKTQEMKIKEVVERPDRPLSCRRKVQYSCALSRLCLTGPNAASGGKFCKPRWKLFPAARGKVTSSGQQSAFHVVACPVLNRPRMNVNPYQAAAAMNGHVRWQELMENNLAASSVPGYRDRESCCASVAAGRSGAPNSRFVIPAVSSHLNFKRGSLRATNAQPPTTCAPAGFHGQGSCGFVKS